MRHARVSVTILDRLTGLPPEAKAVYFALLLGPHRTSAPGLFRAGPAALAEACEITPDAFAASVAALVERGLVMADFPRHVVFLPTAVEDDPPAGPKVVISWKSVLDELPACEVKVNAWRVLRDAASSACVRAGRKAREEGKKLAVERWEEILGPEPRAVSETTDAPNTNGLPNGMEKGIGRTIGKNISPSPSPSPTQTPPPSSSQSQTQTTDGEEERGLGRGENTPPLAAFASGSGGGGAEDSSRVGSESEEPLRSFVPPTREEILRIVTESGNTATSEDVDEFFAHFEPRRWMHERKPLTPEKWLAAFVWLRAHRKAELRRRFEKLKSQRAALGAG